MQNKYIPPHLRQQDGSVKQSNPSTSSRNQSSRFSNFRQNDRRSNSRHSNPRQNQNYNQNQNFNSNSSDRYSYTNQTVVSYVEQQRAKGIDPFKKPEPSTTTSNQPKGRFAAFDVRASGGNSRFGDKLTSLGFNGSTTEDPETEARLFGDVKNTGINFDKYDAIPVEVSGHGAPKPLENFTDAVTKELLPEELMKNLERCGFVKPTPVQKYSVPIALANRDLMACAQTGSGKTGGFLFPIISSLLRNGAHVVKQQARSRYYSTARPNALILGPTRELVIQIFEEATKFCYATGIKPVVVYGGADSRNQRSELRGGADIVVGTPGRLIDFAERGDIELLCVQMLVLDEADRMLDMGFEPAIRRIVDELDLPVVEKRRTMMFSATFPVEIQRLAQDFMSDYIFLTVGRVGSAAKDITQTLQWVQDHEKKEKLVSTLNAIEGGLVLIFVQTKRNAESLQIFLYEHNFPTASIHGDRSQQERELALQSFRNGDATIMVATDVAARGLDIENVTYVINYDMPQNIDDYVHRIGRTGRAGNKGTALSFFNEKSSGLASKLTQLLTENNQTVPEFLKRVSNNSFGGYNRNYGRNNGGFGSRDFRNKTNNNNNNNPRNTNSNNNNNRPSQKKFMGGGGRTSNAAKSNVTDAW